MIPYFMYKKQGLKGKTLRARGLKYQTVKVLGIGFALLGVTGCASLDKATKVGRSAPDEFLIVSKPFLIVPPEYNLKPVRPGDSSPEDILTEQEKNRSLFAEVDPARPSDAEALLLARANAGAGDPTIKLLLDAEAGVHEKSKDLTRSLLYETPDADKASQDKTLGKGEIEIKRKHGKKLPGL